MADPGRLVPDVTTGPVRLTDIRFTTTPDGLTLQANAKNTSPNYLNAATLTWQLLDATNAVQATGSVVLTVAPAETTTLHHTASGPRTPWTHATFHLKT